MSRARGPRVAARADRRYPSAHNKDVVRRGAFVAGALLRQETTMRPPSRHTCALLLAFALAGCSRPEPQSPITAPTPPASRMATLAASLDDESALILPDLMDLVVDPAAGVLFAAADRHAWTDHEPRSDEAWQAVTDAAAQLAQISDTLGDPALTRGRADWRQWVEAMREGAATAGAAARRHDPRSLFSAGVQVRASCQACHARYATRVAEPLALGAPRQR